MVTLDFKHLAAYSDQYRACFDFRLARSGKWNDLKKLAKTKKLPMSVTSIVKLARKHGGENAAKMFLTDEFLNNEDKFNLMVKFSAQSSIRGGSE